MNRIIFTVCMMFLISWGALGHGKQHKDEEETIKKVDAVEKGIIAETNSVKTNVEVESAIKQDRTVETFPTFHPLVVHFPIALLLAAPVFLILGWLIKKPGLHIASFLCALAGFAGALVASKFVVHPHTLGLTFSAMQILKRHELWAEWTVYLSASSLLLFTGASGFPRFRKILFFIVLLLLTGSAITVSLAGHEGAKLTHLHGVGPLGGFLEGSR